jgi:hypothetical protein
MYGPLAQSFYSCNLQVNFKEKSGRKKQFLMEVCRRLPKDFTPQEKVEI